MPPQRVSRLLNEIEDFLGMQPSAVRWGEPGRLVEIEDTLPEPLHLRTLQPDEPARLRTALMQCPDTHELLDIFRDMGIIGCGAVKRLMAISELIGLKRQTIKDCLDQQKLLEPPKPRKPRHLLPYSAIDVTEELAAELEAIPLTLCETRLELVPPAPPSRKQMPERLKHITANLQNKRSTKATITPAQVNTLLAQIRAALGAAGVPPGTLQIIAAATEALNAARDYTKEQKYTPTDTETLEATIQDIIRAVQEKEQQALQQLEKQVHQHRDALLSAEATGLTLNEFRRLAKSLETIANDALYANQPALLDTVAALLAQATTIASRTTEDARRPPPPGVDPAIKKLTFNKAYEIGQCQDIQDFIRDKQARGQPLTSWEVNFLQIPCPTPPRTR